MNPATAQSAPAANTLNWRGEMRRAIRSVVELYDLLGLPADESEAAARAARDFPIFAPAPYVGRMRRGDPSDPLLRQVAPLMEETHTVPGFFADPLAEGRFTNTPGLLRKYRSRALLVTTGACAVHCRYCFRRHFPYEDSPRSLDDWRPALEVLAADAQIREVILSGGDPLTLVDETLAALTAALADIPHIQRLRIHTRLPVVIPSRVTDELLAWLQGSRLTPYMVIHANHPAEIDEAVAAAVGRMIDGGIPVMNQAVLLAGVNDDVDVLTELCERLVDLRVTPYYLHQLDRTAGVAHFEVPVGRGLAIVAELRRRLSGYAVPRYVQEIPGEAHKRVLL